MADLGFIVLLVAFFALAVGLVRACDRIIGSDEVRRVDDADDGERLAA